jgi:uncharacterized protein with von Willebrand factor type A (vWA) domain
MTKKKVKAINYELADAVAVLVSCINASGLKTQCGSQCVDVVATMLAGRKLNEEEQQFLKSALRKRPDHVALFGE